MTTASPTTDEKKEIEWLLSATDYELFEELSLQVGRGCTALPLSDAELELRTRLEYDELRRFEFDRLLDGQLPIEFHTWLYSFEDRLTGELSDPNRLRRYYPEDEPYLLNALQAIRDLRKQLESAHVAPEASRAVIDAIRPATHWLAHNWARLTRAVCASPVVGFLIDKGLDSELVLVLAVMDCLKALDLTVKISTVAVLLVKIGLRELCQGLRESG